MRTLCEYFEEIAGGALLVAMCLICGTQVVSRYVLTSPLAWTEELATMFFAWLVFIGASLALKRNEHFAIDLIVNLLPAAMRKYSKMVRHLAVLLFCLLLVIYGVKLAVMNWHVLTPMLEVSRGWTYLSLPMGGVLMLARTVGMMTRRCPEGDPLPQQSGEGIG